MDNYQDKIVEVQIKANGTVHCEQYGSQDCEHMEYVLELPEVLKRGEELGWKRKRIQMGKE